MQGVKNYEEKLFTQVQLTKRIPRDNYYRKLKKQLKLNFIYKQTAPYYGAKGKHSLDPVVFFKLCLIKHLEGISSEAKLMDFCNLRLDIIFFLNYNLDDKLPHWNTIYRTKHVFPEDVYNGIMEKIIQMATVVDVQD